MLKPSLPTLAVLGLAVLSGCGGAAGSAAPSPSPAAAGKRHQLEAAKADCMKQRGFRYVAYVQPTRQTTEEDRRRASGDYEAMRKYREKYGFGVFALYVYPKEMGNPAVKPDNPEINPNWAIQSALSKSQLQAYHKALNGCMTTAANEVLGLDIKSDTDYMAAMYTARDRALKSALNSDPRLVEPAADMATCLKGKGYAVGDTSPTAMSEHGSTVFRAQEDRLGREQRDDVPDVAPPPKEGEVPLIYAPTLSPEQARPYLDREIKAALDDLECGKDFYPTYQPKQSAVDRQVNEQFGFGTS
ncbi:hypothetical protein ITP53_23570 [Nonomuraea sp. K274]|uniref:Uncharacterized protein n=1 Tax=Nonomuraea cypriaca TaxID=1187855 RepID=A0A931AB75_9ACTN|nr:hypothetical protein [Nonomuraea cypriaca]MBF8188653.1 hypothetical protein [Nonomuraea cypriaca]